MQQTNFITIERKTGNGRYSTLIDVCDRLRDKYGSPTNALAQLASQSPEFSEQLEAMQREQAESSAA